MLEEAAEVKVRKAPEEPTKEEREIHEATHTLYRLWCKFCVSGEARDLPHVRGRENEEGRTRKRGGTEEERRAV